MKEKEYSIQRESAEANTIESIFMYTHTHTQRNVNILYMLMDTQCFDA